MSGWNLEETVTFRVLVSFIGRESINDAMSVVFIHNNNNDDDDENTLFASRKQEWIIVSCSRVRSIDS